MPKPPHLCSCGRIVPHGARCQCQIASTRARNARHDAHRPSARQRGYDSKWEKERAMFLIYHATCKCGQPASVVDHITPHRGDKKLFWDYRNWQSLCAHCHNSLKQRQERSGV
jgi:5-methylcytosine-specific restriction protein A